MNTNMKLNFLLTALSIAGVLCDKQKVSTAGKKEAEPKPKREATVAGSGSYYGPSYKYLPPSFADHTRGYDSQSGGHHSASGNGDSYDVGSLSLGGIHGHEGDQFGFVPKVETYIIQTKTARGNYGSSERGGSHGLVTSHGVSGLNGFDGSYSGSGSHSPVGYKYSGPASFSSGYSGFGGNPTYAHSPVHKVKAIIVPAHAFSSNGYSGKGYTRLGNHNSGYGYANGLTDGSHYTNHIGGGYPAYGSGFVAGYDSGPSSESGFSNARGPHTFEQGNEYSTHALAPPNRESEHSGSQGGYSYGGGIPSYSHAPLSIYAAPSIFSQPYQGVSVGQQAPAYATGHKGLGYFGYAASKPQVLNTKVIGSHSYGGSNENHGHDSYGAGHGISRAQFKPSLFLGTSYQGSSSEGAYSTEYGPPATNHGISSQYLQPPTSEGYDHALSSAVYGGPTDVSSHVRASGAAHESKNTYLPPSASQTNYGPPVTPDNSYQ